MRPGVVGMDELSPLAAGRALRLAECPAERLAERPADRGVRPIGD